MWHEPAVAPREQLTVATPRAPARARPRGEAAAVGQEH